MSYLVLARKYRPRTFADMVGQEIVTATLRGAITEGRVGHAYLFTGPRGTGKTTTARILAKALNCEKGPAPDPCGECERCRAAENGSEIDQVEIDAASNTGVDNVRELREMASTLPMRARFKVFIIDEVHMLSKPAFNALLKTLEEPPPHVKFLFATTELAKLPETILSRCQVLRLLPLDERTIAARLTTVFEREAIRPGAGVVEELARRARGGMRDALSQADQLLALSGDEPTLAELERLAVDGGGELWEQILERIEAGDRLGLFSLLPASAGGEGELLGGLLEHVRHTLLATLCGVDHPLVPGESEAKRRMMERGQRVGVERLQIWMEELLIARERIGRLPSHGRVALEVTLFDLCRSETALSLAELAERLAALEQRLASGASAPRSALPAPASMAGSPRPAPAPVPASVRAPAPTPALPPASKEPQNLFARFIEALEQSSPSLGETLRTRGKLVELARGRMLVRLAGASAAEHELLTHPRNLKSANALLARVVGEACELCFENAAPPVRKPKDTFTGQVSELFGGRIEDEG